MENFREFLEARKALLAAEINKRMEELLHGDTPLAGGSDGRGAGCPSPSAAASPVRKRKSNSKP